MTPLVKPSRIFHDVCAYWLMSSAGFNANTPGLHASSITASTMPSPTTCRPCLCVLATARTLYLTLRKLQSSPASKVGGCCASTDARQATPGHVGQGRPGGTPPPTFKPDNALFVVEIN